MKLRKGHSTELHINEWFESHPAESDRTIQLTDVLWRRRAIGANHRNDLVPSLINTLVMKYTKKDDKDIWP